MILTLDSLDIEVVKKNQSSVVLHRICCSVYPAISCGSCSDMTCPTISSVLHITPVCTFTSSRYIIPCWLCLQMKEFEFDYQYLLQLSEFSSEIIVLLEPVYRYYLCLYVFSTLHLEAFMRKKKYLFQNIIIWTKCYDVSITWLQLTLLIWPSPWSVLKACMVGVKQSISVKSMQFLS